MKKDVREKIYVISIMIFFSFILLYSSGLLSQFSKIFSNKEPIAKFDISTNQLLLPKRTCNGSISILDITCKDNKLEIYFKNNGSSPLNKNFIVIVKSDNITAYHGISLNDFLEPNETAYNSFTIKMEEIKSVTLIDAECPNIVDSKSIDITC